tara:strand:- start:245 stop:766 length:522 start_codon:yes stop_codon:yes gene_type:complete
MDYRLMVYDDFFVHPDKVREKALEQKFNQLGNYPGTRTDLCKIILPEMYNEFELAVKPLVPPDSTIIARFQKQTKQDYRKIHQDLEVLFSGIIYLDKDPISNSGTGFYTHIETGWDGSTPKSNNIEVLIGSEFKQTSVIENKFNRMIIYNGNLVHRAEEAGEERLTLVFGVYK